MIPLAEYRKIKDCYCLAYLGPNREYIQLLAEYRPAIEAKYPDLKLFLCSSNKLYSLLEGMPRTLPESDLINYKKAFAHIAEIKENLSEHPIQVLLERLGVPFHQNA
jgi:hypothetical protein